MAKSSLTFLLLVFLYVLNSSEAASISSVTKNTDINGIWQNLAKLNKQRRVGRQIIQSLWSANYSVDEADDDGNFHGERRNDPILQPQAVESAYDKFNYNDDRQRYRRALTLKEPIKTVLKIEHKESGKEEEKADNEEDATEAEVEAETTAALSQSSTVTAIGTTNTQKPNQFSVLILIRDALKKVTTNLPAPAEQVASNALQYFQLFEHFLQQAIEQVIDDVDDEDEENTTDKIDELTATTAPKLEEEVDELEANTVPKEEVIQVQNKPEAENLAIQIAEPVLLTKQIMETYHIEITAAEENNTPKKITSTDTKLV